MIYVTIATNILILVINQKQPLMKLFGQVIYKLFSAFPFSIILPYVNQVVSSKHIFLSFKPLKHQLIKGPNKQKTNLLFLHFDILSLSTILSFHIEFKIVYIALDFTAFFLIYIIVFIVIT